jgi:hypothetical protein
MMLMLGPTQSLMQRISLHILLQIEVKGVIPGGWIWRKYSIAMPMPMAPHERPCPEATSREHLLANQIFSLSTQYDTTKTYPSLIELVVLNILYVL